MKTGPKYKIARRLGAPIFEKTQTQKFKMSSEKGEKGGKGGKGGGRGAKSDFGKQLIEKQKMRFMYGVSEKQFSNYVKKIIDKKSHTPANDLFASLESRLDNVVFRAGLVSTRRLARQVVSHGHIMLNGRKNSVPSTAISAGDIISIREGSLKTVLFSTLDEKIKNATVPVWLAWKDKKASVLRAPSMEGQELMFDLGAIIEFYKR
ncbi:MAG: 30S ribosomal protein S4 [bacterium]|jgi:small subunit ribosomal protein S4